MTAAPDFVQWAHQGGAREQPSNTLRAFEAILDAAGPETGLELDVHLAADRQLVVIHDKTLERTTDGRGRVNRRTAADVGVLNAGWWWHDEVVDDHAPGADHPLRVEPRPPGLGVPTLASVLKVRNRTVARTGHPIPMTIEVKRPWAANAIIRDLQSRTDLAGKGRITLVAFNDLTIWWIRWRAKADDATGEYAFDLAPGILGLAGFWLRSLVGLTWLPSRYARVQVPRWLATPRLVACAEATQVAWGRTDRTVRVDAWTIEDEEVMAALVAVGVHGIMTDSPSRLRRVRGLPPQVNEAPSSEGGEAGG